MGHWWDQVRGQADIYSAQTASSRAMSWRPHRLQCMLTAFLLRNSVECMCEMALAHDCKTDRAGLLKRLVCVSLPGQTHHSRLV